MHILVARHNECKEIPYERHLAIFEIAFKYKYICNTKGDHQSLRVLKKTKQPNIQHTIYLTIQTYMWSYKDSYTLIKISCDVH